MPPDTRGVLGLIDLLDEPVLDAWYGLYATGERRYLDALREVG